MAVLGLTYSKQPPPPPQDRGGLLRLRSPHTHTHTHTHRHTHTHTLTHTHTHTHEHCLVHDTSILMHYVHGRICRDCHAYPSIILILPSQNILVLIGSKI